MREDAAAWMRRRRIRQWAPGEVTLEAIVGQIRRGEWFVVRDDHTVVAAVRVLTNDDSAWGFRPPDALYVHGLVVHRRYVCRALGRRLLGWVESLAATTGRSFIRLDCAEGQLRPALLLPRRRLPRGGASRPRSALASGNSV